MRYQMIWLVMMQGPEWNSPVAAFDDEHDAQMECRTLNSRLASRPKTAIEKQSRYTIEKLSLKVTP